MASPVGLGYQKIVPQALRTLAFGDVSGTYALVGSIFGAGVYYIYIVSSFNANVTISFDGVDDWAVVVPNVPMVVPQIGLAIPGNYGIYVKGTVASGSINVSAIGIA